LIHIDSISPNDFTAKYGAPEIIDGTSVVFHEYNGENFGHVLFDEVLPVFSLQDSFGEPDLDTKLFQYWPKEPIGHSCEWQIADNGGREEENGQVNLKMCEKFGDMLYPMVSSHKLNRLDSLGPKPVCFERVLMGTAMYSGDCIDGNRGLPIKVPDHENFWTLCNHGRQSQFWRFRLFTMKNLGVVDVPVARHQVVIWNRSSDSGRAIHGLPDLADAIRKKFGVKVFFVELHKISIQEP